MKKLRELQTLIYQVVAGADAVTGNNCHEPFRSGIKRIIRRNPRLPAGERISIYANAYFYRLLECLKEEFPATLAVTGSNDFTSLTRNYLVWRPPSEPSIFYAGRYLAEFLRNYILVQRWPFIAELARLERVILEVFHGSEASLLTEQTIRAIPPEQWPSIQLRLHPGVEILRGEWRVTEVLSAVERGDKWLEPAQGANEIIVWRRGISVHYRILEGAEIDALAVLQNGASFAVLCEVIADASSDSDRAALIGQLLARWLADGILVEGDAHREGSSR